MRDLFDKFYKNLFSALPEVERHFHSIDMKRQYNILNRAIYTLLDFRPDSQAAQKQLEELALRHATLRLTRRHYEIFLDTLVKTIGEFGKDGPDQLAAWRCTLEPGIAFLATCQEALGVGSRPLKRKKKRKLGRKGKKGQGPEEAEQLEDEAFAIMPHLKITELLLQVDQWVEFTRHFTHLRSGDLTRDRSLLLTVILADAIDLGLAKMAEACPGTTFYKLDTLRAWHVREETYSKALAEIVNYQHKLAFWPSKNIRVTRGKVAPNYKVRQQWHLARSPTVGSCRAEKSRMESHERK